MRNLKERILSQDEESKLLTNCSDHLKPIIITALNTGMRRNEILKLEWTQVRLGKRIIQITKTKSRRNREVPINRILYDKLVELKNCNSSDYVFPNPETGLLYKSIRHSFENACRRSGIKDFRFHDLRHTFSCRLIQSGCDVETLRSILGHHSITVTERYIHTNEEQKRKAVNLLNDTSKIRLKNGQSCDTDVTQNRGRQVSSLFSIN